MTNTSEQVTIGPVINMAVVRRLNLTRFEAHEMVLKMYPELDRDTVSPWLETVYKGRRIVIVHRRRWGMYRFSGHFFYEKEYAAKNHEGRWIFRARLADFDLNEIPAMRHA